MTNLSTATALLVDSEILSPTFALTDETTGRHFPVCLGQRFRVLVKGFVR